MKLLGLAAGIAAVAIAACSTPASRAIEGAPIPGQDRWVDSVMATLTLREKAAQIVWPSLYGDYTPHDSPQWRRLSSYIKDQKVGGLLMSVGSPIEIAAKLNALQEISSIPLLVGADLEAGAGYR
ncbi:MAG: hypothetical protein ACRD3J_20125, partial [Thermoanaerobaculia bacterium]